MNYKVWNLKSFRFWNLPQFKKSDVYPFNDAKGTELMKRGAYQNYWGGCCRFWRIFSRGKQEVAIWADGTILTENFL